MSNANKIIRLIDGEGGRATSHLVRDIFLKYFDNPLLAPLNDSAVTELESAKIAFTTDGFVIDPLEFPGGNIGKLAVCGTVNDLAASGAKPVLISVSFILEEGLEIERLERFVRSMAETAAEARVTIACGDTKVVQNSKGDGIYITTAGVGVFSETTPVEPTLIKPGDAVIISGSIAQHAASIIAIREGLNADPPITSDCAPLADMVGKALVGNTEIHTMRDPTRGGLGGIIIELSAQSGTKFVLDEVKIPVAPVVFNLCELYGYDPIFMACEGRMVFVLPEPMAHNLLGILKGHPYGAGSAIIGHVEKGNGVILNTKSGGRRVLIPPEGSPLPRIC